MFAKGIIHKLTDTSALACVSETSAMYYWIESWTLYNDKMQILRETKWADYAVYDIELADDYDRKTIFGEVMYKALLKKTR